MADKEQLIRTEILPQLESLANNLWDSERNVEGRKLDKIIDNVRNILNDTHITPKAAYIENTPSMEMFLGDWYDVNDEPPTQKDYDHWVRSTFWGYLECHRNELDNFIKLKRVDD